MSQALAATGCGHFFVARASEDVALRRVLGRVSMDLTAIDATGVTLQAGDWVEVFGPNLPVDEVAAQASTIAYEILTGISQRVARRYESLPR